MADKKKQPKLTKRTLYYFLNAAKKYKGLTFGGLITTPIVIFLRNIRYNCKNVGMIMLKS